jgi:formate dehydrogenase subunit gamma
MQHTHQVWNEARACALIDGLKHLPGATLPILHALQDEFGYVDQLAIPLIADALALSRAEVVGVINFYHDFRQAPPGHHIMRVCRAESCQAMGCESLVSHIEGQLGVRVGDTTPDGAITLQAVYCLGNCALSPAVLMDRDLHGRVSNQRADDLIVAARGG